MAILKTGTVGFLQRLVLTALAMMFVMWSASWLMKASGDDPVHDTGLIETERHVEPDGKPPHRIQVEVDYSEGSSAAWYPKAEAPMLAEMVERGELKPLSERVGPEPVVIRGIDSIGEYGGIMYLAGDPVGLSNRQCYTNLTRFSPGGLPVVPHVAKSFAELEGGRVFEFHLRKGMRWSDGDPFDVLDIRYWYLYEALDPAVSTVPPEAFMQDGKVAELMLFDTEGGAHRAADVTDEGVLPDGKTLDAQRFQFRFEKPNGIFLGKLTRAHTGLPNADPFLCGSPSHFLKPYHPSKGDVEVIEAEMTKRNMTTPKALYQELKHWRTPEHPRLWPWLLKIEEFGDERQAVRNPYYFGVDEAGNQLPYIDALHFKKVDRDRAVMSAASGGFSIHEFKVKNYTILAENRDFGKYDIVRWFRADRSDSSMHVNVNRKWKFDDNEELSLTDGRIIGKPLAANVRDAKGKRMLEKEHVLTQADVKRMQGEGVEKVWVTMSSRVDEVLKQKAMLLRNKQFRRALSLAIDRQEIIEIVYHGETTPAQCAPGPESPWYHPGIMDQYVAYDPARANAIFDELGLKKGADGFRRLPDGGQLKLSIECPEWFFPTTANLIAKSWQEVGLDAKPWFRNNAIFYVDKRNLSHDFTIFTGNNETFPILDPRMFVPTGHEANFAIGNAAWYKNGGLYDLPTADTPECLEPDPNDPLDAELLKAMRLYDEIKGTMAFEDQKVLFDQILDIAAENLWTISICTSPNYTVVVEREMRNVPVHAAYTFDFIAPGNTAPEIRYFMSEDRRTISSATTDRFQMWLRGNAKKEPSNAGAVIRWLLLICAAGFVVLIGVRHPYVGRRVLFMIPTLGLISVLVFFIIELPEGSFVENKILELQSEGTDTSEAERQKLIEQYGLDKPAVVRYFRWVGLSWFTSFDEKDAGLIQGNLGRAMSEGNQSINDIVGDRIMLTVLISLGTIILTWVIAIPTGIYSAVRQYSPGDYIFTFIGFVGMCVPSFLFAVILMYLAKVWFGVGITGLFSREYAAMPEWSVGKVIDLLKHIWLPVVMLALTGTGGMIRVMRGNLLDELKKPYVTTARAKGVRPMKLLFKYPVRLAINPFVSTIGGLFPQLVAGGAIVAMVLSLPTIGPMLLNSVLVQDTYLAGSLLMVLSILGVIGTLISDLLLLWLDPRIRMEGGSK